ncbi:MAG: hypothetical protein MPN21_11040 [Thermoanaerobaculia bacterium]|nr:hypothetical protein [Thermoanaerobaculia bacterium]
MPEGVGSVVLLLCVGYFLFLAEALVPGGILGILGAASIVWGCWLAFGLSMGWGLSSIVLSIVVFFGLSWFFVKNRSKKGLVLGGDEAKTWKSAKEGLTELVGVEGKTLTPLRPAGTMLVDEERIDVVADGEFIDSAVRVRVIEVEGTRVVVEPVAELDEGAASTRRAQRSDIPDHPLELNKVPRHLEPNDP